MTGNNSFKVKWWEVSLRMQGGRKKEVQEELSSSDANADGARGRRLINVLQHEKDFLTAQWQE